MQEPKLLKRFPEMDACLFNFFSLSLSLSLSLIEIDIYVSAPEEQQNIPKETNKSTSRWQSH